MSVYDFCGTWEEQPEHSKNVDELLRALHVRESKIQESLNVNSTQRIWVKGQVLVTTYSNGLGEVMSSYSLNGGWRVSSKDNTKQKVSRCSYNAATRTLVIEKKLQKQGGLLKDTRRVEKSEAGDIFLSQRLEFVPNRKQGQVNGNGNGNGNTNQEQEQDQLLQNGTLTRTVVASRTWYRVYKHPLDNLLDRLKGVWIVDEEASDSLRPIFEAMNLPPTKIRSALAQKTQHSIILSGPRELLFVHQSVHGDVKSTTHPVRIDAEPDKPLPVPEKGQMACYATSDHSITVVSMSEDGSSSNCDERSITLDGLVINQTITFQATNAATAVTVHRRWIRAPVQPESWAETIPSAALMFPVCDSKQPVCVHDSSAGSNVQDRTATECEKKSEIPRKEDTVEVSLKSSPEQRTVTATTTIRDTALSSSNDSVLNVPGVGSAAMANHFAVLTSCLIVATILRPLAGDIVVGIVVVPLFLFLRFRATTFTARVVELLTPWVRTILLLLTATLLAFYPNADEADDEFSVALGDSALLMLVLCVFAWSRFLSESRTTYLETVSDQWLALSVAYLAVTIIWSYGFPKLVQGDDVGEPGLAPILSMSLLATLGLRQYAANGPPPRHHSDEELVEQSFQAAVDDYRIGGNGKFSEYHLYIVTSDGKKYSVWRRYSAFLNLRNDLGRPDLELPPKRLFGSTSETIMAERKRGLDAFIKRVFEEGGEALFEKSHALRMFAGAHPV